MPVTSPGNALVHIRTLQLASLIALIGASTSGCGDATGPSPSGENGPWRSLSLGATQSCATTNQDAYCWGENTWYVNYRATHLSTIGQLGDSGTGTRYAPSRVAGGFGLNRLAGGYHFTCALTDGGRTYCWGLGQATGAVEPPIKIFPALVPTDKVFVSLAAGDIVCGLTADGTGYCWGDRGIGAAGYQSALGPGPAVEIATPLAAIAPTQGERSCAITTGGDVWCWDYKPPTLVRSRDKFVSVGVGYGGGCALTATGILRCWDQQQRMLDSMSLRYGDTAGSPTVVAIPSPANLSFTRLAITRTHACAIASSGDLYCWGGNDRGELGDGSVIARAAPTRVISSLKFRDVALGSHHSCAITVGGAMYCWGDNSVGQAGIGDTHADNNYLRVPTLVAPQP